MIIKHLPPRIFEKLFFDKNGTKWGNEIFYMEYTHKSGANKKCTSRVPQGKIPYEYLSATFNKKLSWQIQCADSIQRDIKEINVTYTHLLGNLNMEMTTMYLLPYSTTWQSLN